MNVYEIGEGVRSFNIDFAAKKVTVSGKVTPLEVLSSISKVKNAQLWAPTIASEFRGPFPLLNTTATNKGVAAASWVLSFFLFLFYALIL